MRPSPIQNSPSTARTLRAALTGIVLAGVFASGCVYRINIQQGNFLDDKALAQVEPGLTRSQVRYLLGTPLVSAAFDTDRWDYVYYFKRGYSRQVQERKVTVYFENDKVTRVDKPAAEPEKKAEVAKTAETNGA